MNKKNNNVGVLGFIAIIIIGVLCAVFFILKNVGHKDLKTLVKKVDITTATPEKAPVSLDDNSLYDELPEINKYPLGVVGKGQIDIEIFSSPEKAETGSDGWLIECAERFNNENHTTSDGKTVSISVRDVSSGLAADYIISGKYLPDLYTPSNELWGEYINFQSKGRVDMLESKLVGNTAGFLVKNNTNYSDYTQILDDIVSGKLNVGYTNPQVSSAGMNLLLTILLGADANDITSDTAKTAFASFQNNIPYVAYNTVQMKSSAALGSLDGMITEYQSYISDKNLQKNYKFIPYGIRHDNPLYVVDKNFKTDEELEAIDIIKEYLLNNTSQSLATKYGFNQNEDYESVYSITGTEVAQALKVYKSEKDSGKDIIAVFVADCSGSMSGSPIMELKDSLTNGMGYINDNNYVGFVSYSNDVTIELPIAQFDLNQKAYFQGAINSLVVDGGTSTYEALCVGMDMIEKAKVDHPDAKCMLFLLSDGRANGWYDLSTIKYALEETKIPVYTIAYGEGADKTELQNLSNINEAASISADSDDIIYKIKSLFNAQL